MNAKPKPYVAARFVRVDGTGISWTGLGQWVARVMTIGEEIRPSYRHYRRCGLLFDSLEDVDIGLTFDMAALTAAERLFDAARIGQSGLFRGPERHWPRDEIARRLQLIRARRVAIATGRALHPRAKGPRLDPGRLPNDRLEALIQRHRDLDVVERLREERRRRQRAATDVGGPVMHM